MSAEYSLEIILDGTGGALAIDNKNNVTLYVQSVHESDTEVKHRAVRLLVPIIYGFESKIEATKTVIWEKIRDLEFATGTIFVLVERNKTSDDTWQEDLCAYKNLARKYLNWKILPLPYDQLIPPEGGALISSILEGLQDMWEALRLSQSSDDVFSIEKILTATKPSKDVQLIVNKLAAEAYTSRDYGRKRLASFAEYVALNPVSAIADLASDFHRTALDGNELAACIDHSIMRYSPFSFIRVGEGEGCFLSYEKYQNHRDGTHEVYGVCAKDIYRIWFDRDIHNSSADELIRIRSLFWDAIQVADVLGVPTPERAVYEYAHFLDDMKRHGYNRGYVGVAEILSYLLQASKTGLLREPMFADCDIARPLYGWQDWSSALASTLPSLLKGKKDVTCVTCHPQLGGALERVLGLTQTRTILIPPERGRVKDLGMLAGDHYFDHFNRVNEELLRDPGAIVLVAGGFLGKAYCASAKAASAVAIDIGSLADYWVGVNTRSKNAWKIPSPFQFKR